MVESPISSLFLFCSRSERGGSIPKGTGGKKKKPMPKQQKENLVFVTDFGEKISLFLPGFDSGEMTAELVHNAIRTSCREKPV